ncbi:MAG: HAMP domain-containing histidine kinase [Deltaproteobacteria bacterium]|nr:HAMP domain-containing histidine kinase [Deltaproteobacteria bacterium]
MAAANYVFSRLVMRFTSEENHRQAIRRTLIAQVLADFFALSVITYALGSIETPVLILFMPHVILVTIFFNRVRSFLMTLVGVAFASTPMILEVLGVLPVQSLYDESWKPAVIGSPVLTLAYLGGISAFYLVSWYLISEISTSLQRREHQLEDAYEQLMLLDKEKTLATLRATHELKAPFAAIKSYGYVMRDGYAGELPDKARVIVGRISERCDLLMAKITNIIQLSSLKTVTQQAADLQTLDLIGVVLKEAAEARVVGEPRDIRMNNHLAGEPPAYVRASREQMHMLFSNLLHNAVIYSKSGGAVDVSARRKPGTISIRVSDQGIGIPKENIPKIFDAYFRSNNAVEHNPNGTGLGLPIVKEVVRLHNAVLHVSSEMGRGTCFTVTFNLVDQPNPEDEDHGENIYHR